MKKYLLALREINAMAGKRRKQGMLEVPMWLILSLIGLVVLLWIVWMNSEKAGGIFASISNLFRPG